MKKNTLFLSVCATMLFSCSSSSTQEPNSSPPGGNPNTSAAWTIPISEVLDGGPGKDGIPALENPSFVAGQSAGVLKDNDLVL